MDELVAQLQAAAASVGGGVLASDGGQAVGGDVRIRAEGGSVAALRMGDVVIGSAMDPHRPGPEQG